MNNRFFDLAWNRQQDGSIRLTQIDCSEKCIVDAHPEQLLFVARQLCGMKPDDAHKVAELERHLSILTDRLDDLVAADWLRNQIINRCEDGIEIITKLDALLDLAFEFDGGRLLPSGLRQAQDGAAPLDEGLSHTTPRKRDSGPANELIGLNIQEGIR